MNRSRANLFLFQLIGFFFYFENIACADVQFSNCWKPEVRHCTVHSVKIDPCFQENGLATDPCELRRGVDNATLVMEYTTDFNTTDHVLQMAHKSEPIADIPLEGMDTEACHYTTCPIIAGERSTYTFPIEIKEVYPEGPYTIKWKLWNDGEAIKEACCLKFKIVLH
ncbi:hypothetical protein WDU94_009207 [Cyamophila willieti]